MTNSVYEIGMISKEIFYIDKPFEYIGNLEKLKQLLNYKLVVVNACSEHWGAGSGSGVVDNCQQANLNFLVLSHNPRDHLLHPRMMYFPYWYHTSKKYFKKVETSVVKKYKLGCLNGNPRPHRIANYLLLLDKTYADQICVSFFNTLPVRDPDNTSWRADDVMLDELEINLWNQIKKKLPIRSNSNVSDQELDIPALTDSYIHLVTETTVVPNIFITEKTWKPIASGMLFLIFGNCGTVDHLRELGVDVFDDIIDHKYYDNQSDWRIRLECIHTLVDYLVNQDLEKIYKATHYRRLENQRKFFNGDFDPRYNQEILLQIEKLKNV
jgi:hypothetical protein